MWTEEPKIENANADGGNQRCITEQFDGRAVIGGGKEKTSLIETKY